MEWSDSYFEDEVKEGFYVPSMIKRAWAASLEVLFEFDRVCQKYNIPYFADWGTLIGAVRSKGFIPWDDDIDINMRREDLNRFIEVAAKELPEGYEVYGYKENEDYWGFVTKVVAKRRICFEEEHLKQYHGFPYITGIDIFILDYVYDDEEKEKNRAVVCKYILAVADGIADGSLCGQEAETAIRKIEDICNTKVIRFKDITKFRVQMYDLVVKLFSMVSKEDAKCVTRMVMDGLNLNLKCRFPKEYYEDIIRLPFENMMIPVPREYDKVLTGKFGDYRKDVRNGGGAAHCYPFFEAQKQQLQAVLDFEMPHFSFDSDLLNKNKLNRDLSIKGISEAYIKYCVYSLERVVENIDSRDFSATLDLLVTIQQETIAYAECVEKCKGENYITVRWMEEYCEYIYQLYETISKSEKQSGDIAKILLQLSECQGKISNSITNDILNRKEIVFMPFKAQYWGSMEKIYQETMLDKNCDVYVIVLPYYYKEYEGSFKSEQYEAELFPSEVKITSYLDFDFTLHQPEQIYIQNPYDEWNSTISVPTEFYSGILKTYTDELIYIPYFILDEFDQNCFKEYHNMQYYCTMPGVINADKVIVQSENMKNVYVEKLSEFAGEETRSIWNKKIVTKKEEKKI